MRRATWMALGAVVLAGAAQDGDWADRFGAKPIPDPPGQGAPWVAPATRLPRFLVTATGLLLDQGVADPRGCAYRAVEIGGNPARGFVLPERAGVPERYVVAWDGLVYAATQVGEPLDLDAEIRELAAHARATRAANRNQPWPAWVWAWPSDQGPERPDRSGVGDHSPLKVGLLLRLGRADLAEMLFAAATGWDPERRGRDLTDYAISYRTLAEDWATPMHERLIVAHARGRDAVALDTARRLARFRDRFTRQADAMGFERGDRDHNDPPGPIPYFAQLDDLDALLRDQERRAKLGPRGPVPPRGGDPAARVAALIRDLDLKDDPPRKINHLGYRPENSQRMADLVAEGDAAVGPLLDALAVEDRLLPSITSDRHGQGLWYIHAVAEVEFAALTRLVPGDEAEPWGRPNWLTIAPADRRALVEAIRRAWLKGRVQSPAPGPP